MSSTEEFVNSTIKSNTVAIFSKSYCPYCTMAKEAFKKVSVNYHAVELDKRDDCDDIQDCLGRLTGARSVPRVFVNGKFIGGGSDVKEMQENGELLKLFQK